MKKTTAAIAVALLAFCGPARAGDGLWLDVFEPYFQRTDSITTSAGNARDVNAVTHMIDPWPRYVRDRRIPGNGERLVGAMERYRDPRKLKEAPPPIVPTEISPKGFGGGAGR